jgi:hypothetical protein
MNSSRVTSKQEKQAGRQFSEKRIVLWHVLHITWSATWSHSHANMTDETLCIKRWLRSEIKELVCEFDYWCFTILKMYRLYSLNKICYGMWWRKWWIHEENYYLPFATNLTCIRPTDLSKKMFHSLQIEQLQCYFSWHTINIVLE